MLIKLSLQGVAFYYDEINDVIYNDKLGLWPCNWINFEDEEIEELRGQIQQAQLAKK